MDAAPLSLDSIRRVELETDELHTLVAPKALEQHPARAAEVEDSLAPQIACRGKKKTVRLRIAVLDVAEETFVELPRRIVWKFEQLAHRPSVS